jgi:hypothetical protein
MEKKTEVRVFEVSYICDKCNEGEMIYIGEFMTNFSLKYRHRCEKCFDIHEFNVVYPQVRYEPIGIGRSDMIGNVFTLTNIS